MARKILLWKLMLVENNLKIFQNMFISAWQRRTNLVIVFLNHTKSQIIKASYLKKTLVLFLFFIMLFDFFVKKIQPVLC